MGTRHWAESSRIAGRRVQQAARAAVLLLDRAYHVTARTHVNDSSAARRRGGYSRAAKIEGPTREPRN